MTQDILIIGAGDVGGFIASNEKEFMLDIKIAGFLDDDPEKIGKTFFGHKVFGPINSIKDFENIGVAIGINKPPVKRSIIQSLKNIEVLFPKLISKHAWVSEGVQIGEGCIIYPGCSINHGAKLGSHVIMNMNCAIGHNSNVGSFSSLAPGVNFAGFTQVEEGVEVGVGVATKQNVSLGSDSVIGGQAMVTKDIPANTVAYGVPAEYKQK